MTSYVVNLRTPTVDEYRRLRAVAGLTQRSAEGAALGLANTFIGVVIEMDGHPIGMGRIIGDGALFFQVVDIAVEPGHQGRGVGKAIMGALMGELRKRATTDAYVSLIADGKANRLYAQFGFEPVAPTSTGMAMWLR
jgi:GNAT superfamily N-acetyltransferase